jgi:zinc protease
MTPSATRTAMLAGALTAVLWAGVASAQFQSVNWPTEAPPRPLAPRQMNFPPYEIRTLSNGLRVIAVQQNEQPAVTMRLLIGAGAAKDPARKAGTARLVASLLDQGTTTRSAPQIADQIDSIGGSMGTGSGADLSNVYAVVMKDSFALAMDLLHDVVRNPAFAPEEIERQKEQASSSLQVNSNDPDYVASVLFDRLVYGFHPYGVNETPASLEAITRDDLRGFHRQHFVPNNMVLAIVGDVSHQEAFATAEKVFGQWPRADVVNVPFDPPPDPTRRIVVVDKPDSVQTEIRVGQLAIPRKHPEYAAWDLAVKILGGEGANRLHQVLRSERGLTYGASADTQANKQAGDFVAETDTRTETTGEALRLMVEEFSRLQRQRVSERELSGAQAYLAGSFPLTLETPNDLATQLLQAVFYELDVEEIRTFRDRVTAITPDDIQRVARQYIRPDRLSIVLVGNAKGFVNQLRAVGFNEFDVIPIGELDFSSPTLRRERGRTARAMPAAPSLAAQRPAYSDQRGVGSNAPTSPTAVAPDAQTVLRQVIDARGGLDALKAVRTVVVDAETTLHMQQSALPTVTRTYVVYPERFRVDAKVQNDEIVQVYNAGTAWERSPAGVRDAPPAMRDDFAANVRRDTIPLLLAASEGRLQVRLLPSESRPDGRQVRVLEIGGPQLEPVRLFVDNDNLIVAQAYSTVAPNNRRLRNEEVFSDYRVVSGVRVPFRAQLLQGGRPVVSRVIKNVSFNVPVADSLFARP